MTTLHKIELYIHGSNNQDESTVQDFVDIILEGNGRMHSGAVDFYAEVGDTKTIDVGEWSDDHLLNYSGNIEKIRSLFNMENPAEFCEEEVVKKVVKRLKDNKVDYGLVDIAQESYYELDKVKNIMDRLRAKGEI